MSNLEALNNQLFLAINGAADSPAWLVECAKIAGDDLVYLIPALLVGLWLQGGSDKRGLALRAFAVAMLGVGINQVIGLGWQHPRPFMLGIGHAWIEHAADSSFPSDHATVFFGIGFSLLMGSALGLGIAALLAAIAVAWARIFLGVHFPMDMVGAALVALASWALIAPVWAKAGTWATRLAESAYRRMFAWPISLGWIKS